MGDNTAIDNTLTGARRRAAPPVVSGSPAAGPVSGGASLPTVQAQRGARKLTIYKFKIPITQRMRDTKPNERRKRHLLVWEAIFAVSSDQFMDDFNTLYRLSSGPTMLDGLYGIYLPTDKHINYKLDKETYHKLDFPHKLPPSVDDQSPIAEQLAIGVIETYKKTLKKLTPEQGDIVDRKLKFILERISQDALTDDPDTLELLRLLESAVEKTAELDDYGLIFLNGNALSYRNQFSNKQVYSPQNAKEFLYRYHNVLDILLIARRRRQKDVSRAIKSYNQAHKDLADKIPALQLLQDIASLNETINLPSGKPDGDDALSSLKADARHEKRIVQEKLNRFLKRKGFTKKLVKTQRKAFAEAFKELLALSIDQSLTVNIRLVSFEVTRQRKTPGYFAQLYLDWVSGAAQKDPGALRKKYPIIQFFDGDVLSMAKRVKGNSRYQHSPETFFAVDLNRLARRRLKDLIDARNKLRKEKKRIWNLDKAIKEAFGGLEIANTSYQWVVTSYAKQEKKKGRWKRILLDVVLFAISLVPVGRVIGTLVKLGIRTSRAAKAATTLKVGVAGVELAQAKELHDETKSADLLKRVGLRSDSPSYLWVVLSVTGAGLDLADLVKFSKVAKSEADVVKDLNDVAPENLSGVLKDKYGVRDTKLIKSIVRKRRSADKMRQAFADLSKATGNRLSSIMGVANELSVVAFHMIKTGILEADVFINAMKTRRYFNKLTPGQLQKLYEIHGEQLIRVLKTTVKIPKSLSGKIDGATVKWLMQNGMWTSATARQFGRASGSVIESLNTFRLSPGFEKVVADWLAKGYKQDGARFVMRYALKNFKVPAKQIRFEVVKPRNPTLDAAGKTSGNPVRIRDVVVKFDNKSATSSGKASAAGGGSHEIKFEFKSIKEVRRNLVYKLEGGRRVPGQLYKDLEELLMQLGPDTSGRVLRWVINGKKGLTKKQAFDQFVKYINETGLAQLPAWKKEGEALLWSILEIAD